MICSERTEMFKKYLDKLFNELMSIETHLELYVYIYNLKATNLSELNLAPAFFGNVIQVFLSNTIFSLSRIYENYDGRNRSDRNLSKFLDFLEQCFDIFPQDSDYKVDASLIKKHRGMIDNHKEVLNNLFAWRDKHFAHFDKHYFFETEKLSEDYNLTLNNLRTLIQLAKEILNYYSIAYSGTYNAVTPTNLLDIENIIEILADYNKKNKLDVIPID